MPYTLTISDKKTRVPLPVIPKVCRVYISFLFPHPNTMLNLPNNPLINEVVVFKSSKAKNYEVSWIVLLYQQQI